MKNNKNITMKTYEDYTVPISSDPCYYGDCTKEEATGICDSLEGLIKSRFPGISVIRDSGRGAISGPDEDTRNEIFYWIDANWTAAL